MKLIKKIYCRIFRRCHTLEYSHRTMFWHIYLCRDCGRRFRVGLNDAGKDEGMSRERIWLDMKMPSCKDCTNGEFHYPSSYCKVLNEPNFIASKYDEFLSNCPLATEDNKKMMNIISSYRRSKGHYANLDHSSTLWPSKWVWLATLGEEIIQ